MGLQRSFFKEKFSIGHNCQLCKLTCLEYDYEIQKNQYI